MLYGSGKLESLFFIGFGVLQMFSVLRDFDSYNNHDYMFASLACLLAILDIHHFRLNIFYNVFYHEQSDRRKLDFYFCFSVFCVLLVSLMSIALLTGISGWKAFSLVLLLGIMILRLEIINFEASYDDIKDRVSGLSFVFIRGYFGVIYLFATFAKLSVDWLSGYTVYELLEHWTMPSVSTFFVTTCSMRYFTNFDWCQISVLTISSLGILLDLLAAVAYLVLPSTTLVPLVLSLFHLINYHLFVIEYFPLVMICAVVFIFPVARYNFSELENSYFVQWSSLISSQIKWLSHGLWMIVIIVFGLFLALTHSVLPLQCAFPVMFDYGTLSWFSSCQFFMWRMMTRSVSVRSSLLHIVDPNAGSFHYDINVLSSQLYDHSPSLFAVPQYEDYLLTTVSEFIKIYNISSHATIHADIWLEINGPPCQRYINPSQNLAESILDRNRSIFSLGNPIGPYATWVVPRITLYQSLAWKSHFRQLTSHVLQAQEMIFRHWRYYFPEIYQPKNKSSMFYVADTQDISYPSYFLASKVATVVILDGCFQLTSLGMLCEGDCISFVGKINWVVNTSTALAMIITANNNKGFDSFGMMLNMENESKKPTFQGVKPFHCFNSTSFTIQLPNEVDLG